MHIDVHLPTFRDKSHCKNQNCNYIRTKSDCPVKCGLAREGERKCAESECKVCNVYLFLRNPLKLKKKHLVFRSCDKGLRA